MREFSQLPAEVRQAILEHWQAQVKEGLPPITEDSMPGELANIVSGRVANLLNLRGPNFITDAACASSFAAILAAIELLEKRHCDAVIAGGVDRNMGAVHLRQVLQDRRLERDRDPAFCRRSGWVRDG